MGFDLHLCPQNFVRIPSLIQFVLRWEVGPGRPPRQGFGFYVSPGLGPGWKSRPSWCPGAWQRLGTGGREETKLTECWEKEKKKKTSGTCRPKNLCLG